MVIEKLHDENFKALEAEQLRITIEAVHPVCLACSAFGNISGGAAEPSVMNSGVSSGLAWRPRLIRGVGPTLTTVDNRRLSVSAPQLLGTKRLRGGKL